MSDDDKWLRRIFPEFEKATREAHGQTPEPENARPDRKIPELDEVPILTPTNELASAAAEVTAATYEAAIEHVYGMPNEEIGQEPEKISKLEKEDRFGQTSFAKEVDRDRS